MATTTTTDPLLDPTKGIVSATATDLMYVDECRFLIDDAITTAGFTPLSAPFTI